MRNQIVCPAKCNGGYADKVKSVSQREAGITPETARAANLNPNERVSICWYCDCVWRNILDSHTLKTLTVILGEYKGITFRAEPWLEEAIKRLERKPE